MAKVSKYTGKNGYISVGGSEVIVSDFEVTVTRGVASQGRVGKHSDRKAPGKVDVVGALTSIDIDGAMMEKLLGGTPSDSSSEALHASADLGGGGDEEVVDVGTDPTNPSIVKVTITRGDADGTDSWIIIKGTDVDDNELAEPIDVVALTAAVSPLTYYTKNTFKTVDHFVVGAGMNVGSSSYTEVALDAITGNRTVQIDDATTFTIVGRVIDSDSNKYDLQAANCFFTEGGFAVGDADTFVGGSHAFTMEDPDADFSLIYTSS